MYDLNFKSCCVKDQSFHILHVCADSVAIPTASRLFIINTRVPGVASEANTLVEFFAVTSDEQRLNAA